MNASLLSGEIVTRPSDLGGGLGIKFLLKTRYPSRREGVRTSKAYVPCVVFDVNPQQREILLSKDFDKVWVELVGRIVRSSSENENGDRIYNTEVYTNSEGLLLRKVK
jgi:hypothetical protein